MFKTTAGADFVQVVTAAANEVTKQGIEEQATWSLRTRKFTL